MQDMWIELAWLFIESLRPVVQSIFSLMSSLVVKMLTALVSTVSNSQVFCWKNMSKLLTFFQQKC